MRIVEPAAQVSREHEDIAVHNQVQTKQRGCHAALATQQEAENEVAVRGRIARHVDGPALEPICGSILFEMRGAAQNGMNGRRDVDGAKRLNLG